MLESDALLEFPLLVLANKQDVEVRLKSLNPLETSPEYTLAARCIEMCLLQNQIIFSGVKPIIVYHFLRQC